MAADRLQNTSQASTAQAGSVEENIDGHSQAERIGQLLHEGKFCAAAKLYSEMTGSDLIESKLAIDRLARKHDLAPMSGCLSHLAVLMLFSGASAWAIGRWLV